MWEELINRYDEEVSQKCGEREVGKVKQNEEINCGKWCQEWTGKTEIICMKNYPWQI